MNSRVIDWLEGAVNFRDFGGYPAGENRVRTGKLFRSGDPHGLSDVAIAHVAQRLGIRTIIDLRSDSERSLRLVDFGRVGVRMVHEPILTNQTNPAAVEQDALLKMARGEFDWVGLYTLMLEKNVAAFGRMLRLLATSEHAPVLIHCAAGRDRTGVSVALIQMVLGVSDDDIAVDYALTGDLLSKGWTSNSLPLFFNGSNLSLEERIRSTETRAEWMHAVLAGVRKQFGGVNGFLEAAGVTPHHLSQIHSHYLEPGYA